MRQKVAAILRVAAAGQTAGGAHALQTGGAGRAPREPKVKRRVPGLPAPGSPDAFQVEGTLNPERPKPPPSPQVITPGTKLGFATMLAPLIPMGVSGVINHLANQRAEDQQHQERMKHLQQLASMGPPPQMVRQAAVAPLRKARKTIKDLGLGAVQYLDDAAADAMRPRMLPAPHTPEASMPSRVGPQL